MKFLTNLSNYYSTNYIDIYLSFRRKASKRNGSPEKQFKARESRFREMYKNDDVRGWYFVFGAQIFALIVFALVNDIFFER